MNIWPGLLVLLFTSNPLLLAGPKVMMPLPVRVIRQGFGVRGPLKMPATVWLAFMVTVKAGVPVPVLTANRAAVPSTQLTGVAMPPSDVSVLHKEVGSAA